MKINKSILHISLKMIIAGILALVIGYLSNLTYYTTASAVAVLSIQLTKKDFITIAIKRLISSILSITISALMFFYFGQTFIVFGVFLLLFIFLSWLFNAPEGIVLSIVLVGHFLIAGNITISFYLEELLLIIISLGIAFLVNMFYPEPHINQITEIIKKVDLLIEDYILNITSLNVKNYNNEFNELTTNAEMIDKNIVIQNDHRYITYIYMREMQYNVLKNIETNVQRIKYEHKYTNQITNFLKEISDSISINNNASECLLELNDLRSFFLKEELPKNREEFETRAILFQILNDIDIFLNLKIEYHIKYPNIKLIND